MMPAAESVMSPTPVMTPTFDTMLRTSTSFRIVLRMLAVLAIVLAFAALAPGQSRAGDNGRGGNSSGDTRWTPDIGGYSLHRRDIFGLQKAPPPPTDFGPTFDYEAQPMDRGVNNSPYEH